MIQSALPSGWRNGGLPKGYAFAKIAVEIFAIPFKSSQIFASMADDTEPQPGGNSPVKPADESPGCLPAVVAATLLMLMVAFVLCGLTTWILFQKRTEIAARTLEGFIPNIEQSLLEPKDKARVIEQFETLVKQMKDPNYDPAQAAAIMQRIVRLPITHWGEIDAVEAFIEKNLEGPEKVDASKNLSRARHAIEKNQATVFDIVDVLAPVTIVDDTEIGRSLKQPLRRSDVEQVVERAEILADRAKIPDQVYPRTDMADILKIEIQTAKTEGGF